MNDKTGTVGDLVAAFLEASGVELGFGVISIHNMPLLDAFHRRGRIRFVPARGEGGACNMADAAARVSGRLGVLVTSTGTGAGNAAGAMVEAMTAGTPLLHLTGQVETPYLDRNDGYIHAAPSQLAMLKTVSKAAFRIAAPGEALAILREAVRIALTAPAGPVSIEIPIDVQQALVAIPADLTPLPIAATLPDPGLIDRIAARLAASHRPLLWLGGGARQASREVERLARLGIGVITSTAGRGVLPEDHPLCLGAFTQAAAIEELFATIDLMVVIGSHLRSNETRTYAVRLPASRIRIDADPAAETRGYASEMFLLSDAALALAALADRLEKNPPSIGPAFAGDLAAARREAQAELRRVLGPYAALPDLLARAMPSDALWVRDITLSNSLWGNRAPNLSGPFRAVHAMGGGIGQGLAMAIGAALASPGRKTVALIGDGGFVLNMGELATAAETHADITVLLMNDGGYGVIRNIQDAHYGGRRCYADLKNPDFGLIAESLGVPHVPVRDLKELPASFAAALGLPGPAIVEIDMRAIGPFAIKYAGPPGTAAVR